MLPAIVPYLMSPSGVFTSILGSSLLFGFTTVGVMLNNQDSLPTSSSQGTYVHLDTTKNMPLSQQEQSAGWTSSTTGLLPPSGLSRYFPYGSSTLPTMGSGVCDIMDNPVGYQNSLYRSISGLDWSAYSNAGSSASIPMGQSYVKLNYDSYWRTTGTMCKSTSTTQGYDRLYIVLDSPCPYGSYPAANNTTCTPRDATITTKLQKPSDGVCKVVRNGSTFSVSTNDPDCSDNALNPLITNGGGTFNIVDSSDARKGVSMSIDASNRVTISSQKPNADNTNTVNTVVLATTTTTNQNGVASSSNYQPVGQLTQTTTGNGILSTVAPTTSSGNSTVNINLPDNLAKTEDVNAVKQSVDAVKDVLTTDPLISNPVDSASITNTINDLKNKATISTIPSIFSFSPPILSDHQLPDLSLKLSNTVTVHYNIDSWASYIRSLLGILFYLFTPFIIFNIFRGKE